MMRSMFSGVSGLRAHQIKMDTIGNNIANVNTVGFKSSKVSFQEVFSQTVKGAGSPTTDVGGTNPQSIGLGTSIGAIDVIQSKGSSQRTDNPTDLMVDGSGFFVLSNDSGGLNKFYTRAGNFVVDRDGNLVSNNGFKVLGTDMKPVQINKSLMNPAQATSSIAITSNINFNETQIPYSTTIDVFDSLGKSNTVKVEFGNVYTTLASENWLPNDPRKIANPADVTSQGTYSLREMTFTSPTAAGSVVSVPPSTTSVPATAAEKMYAIFNDQGAFVDVYYAATDQKTQLQTAGSTVAGIAALVPSTNPPAPQAAFGALAAQQLGFSPAGAQPILFPINKSLFFENNDVTKGSLTQFAKATDIKGQQGVGTGVNGTKGAAAGSISSFNIASSGEVVAVFTNGLKQTLATVGLADFDNPAGLMKMGNNMFTDTSNSGAAKFGKPGSGSFGALTPGALEMSNVDLAAEFTDMITTQRGFQANSKIITTSDEILQELVNLKR